MQPLNGATVIKKDFNDEDAPDVLIGLLEGRKADVVLSDMAANTTGHRHTDHLRVTHLVELAWDFAKQVLAKDGAFISKVFQGGIEGELLKDLKKHFTKVQHIKPLASRKESPEVYLVATGSRVSSRLILMSDGWVETSHGYRLAITEDYKAEAMVTGIVIHGFRSSRRSDSAAAAMVTRNPVSIHCHSISAHGDSDGDL